MKRVMLAALFGTFALAGQAAGVPACADESGIYPQGRIFPLALYSIDTAHEMLSVKRYGWNIAHTYGFTPDFLDLSARSGFFALAPLPGKDKPIPEGDARAIIADLPVRKNLAWWDLPEERRSWYPNEMAIITSYSQWTRKYDPLKRPNYMYIPGHYLPTDIKPYIPYLDIVPASVYTTDSLQPHAWVRWRMEATIEAIKLAGARIGPDYLGGEKTPVAVVELFYGLTVSPR